MQLTYGKLHGAGLPPDVKHHHRAGLAKVHVWYERNKAGETFTQIAKTKATPKRRTQQMIDRAVLEPDAIREVLEGKQPFGFTFDWCLRHDLPSTWGEQRQLIAPL